MNFHVTITQAVEELNKNQEHPFITLMRHGSMSIEYYKPVGKDLQTPHKQDEIYVIASGKAVFYRNGERMQIASGDVLFVPAGMEHRFEDFTEDFATWVIFYGVDGGEKLMKNSN